MHRRPRLKTHIQPLRRGAGSLQLGVCPATGVVLDGLRAPEIAVVEALEGTRGAPIPSAQAACPGVGTGRLIGERDVER